MIFSEPTRTRWGQWLCFIALLGCFSALQLTALPGKAHAQAALSSEELQRFKLRVSDGKRLFEMGKYRASIEQFQAAREIYDHPRLTFNIAQAFKTLGACAEARGGFERYLAYESLDAEMRTRATRLLGELDTTCVETGRIQISCSPQDARLSLRRINPDQTYGQPRALDCPVDSEIRTGRYEISATAEGHEPRLQQVEIARDATQILQLTLAEKPGWLNAQTQSILAYSLIGVGGATLVGGFISDYSAVSRLDELSAAQKRGELGRINTLRDDADSASTRTAILYGVGGTLLVGGVVWKLIQIKSGAESPAQVRLKPGERAESAAGSRFSVDVGLTGFSTRLQW